MDDGVGGELPRHVLRVHLETGIAHEAPPQRHEGEQLDDDEPAEMPGGGVKRHVWQRFLLMGVTQSIPVPFRGL